MTSPVACSNPSRTALPLPRGASWSTTFDARVGRVREHDLARAVGRVALDDDQLDLDVRDLDAEHALDRGRDGLRLVVDRHDDAQAKRENGGLSEE